MTGEIAPQRLVWLRNIVIAGLIAGMLLSPKLWLSSRLYPQTPVWSALHPIPQPFDSVVYAATLLALALAAVFRKSAIPVVAFFACAAVLALLDQSRWQPWFYQYCFMLLALSLRGNSAAVCRLIVFSVYFWSGMQKLSGGFAVDAFPWLVEPFKIVPAWTGTAVPFVEIAIALALLIRQTRTAALLAAAAMHALILLAIGPLGHNANTVVWPWNLAMAASAFLLFWRTPDFHPRDILWPPRTIFARLVLALFTLAPALSFFDAWDNYLSWALYAGNKNDAAIYMNDAAFDKLPDALQEHVADAGPDRGKIDISTWSYEELNVPAYPEIRVYQRMGRFVCSYTGAGAGVKLVIQSKLAPLRSRANSTYTCTDLGLER